MRSRLAFSLAPVFLLTLSSCTYDPLEAGDGRRQTAARMQAIELDRAVASFCEDVGRLPTEVEGLESLVLRPQGVERWNGPYMRVVPLDPWGRPYSYHVEGGGVSAAIACYEGRVPDGEAPLKVPVGCATKPKGAGTGRSGEQP